MLLCLFRPASVSKEVLWQSVQGKPRSSRRFLCALALAGGVPELVPTSLVAAAGGDTEERVVGDAKGGWPVLGVAVLGEDTWVVVVGLIRGEDRLEADGDRALLSAASGLLSWLVWSWLVATVPWSWLVWSLSCSTMAG